MRLRGELLCHWLKRILFSNIQSIKPDNTSQKRPPMPRSRVPRLQIGHHRSCHDSHKTEPRDMPSALLLSIARGCAATSGDTGVHRRHENNQACKLIQCLRRRTRADDPLCHGHLSDRRRSRAPYMVIGRSVGVKEHRTATTSCSLSTPLLSTSTNERHERGMLDTSRLRMIYDLAT